MKSARIFLGAVCALVIAVYAHMAQSGVFEWLGPNPAESYYNLLVEGFHSGHLSLKKEAPHGLVQLADPYDPAANAVYGDPPYRLHDLSYYKGRLYLYFGVTPALILFWPVAALTGHHLFHRQAVAIFCATGFLASVGLLRALWRRHFADVSAGVVAACAVALGLATGVPVLLSRCEVYEVPISCAYMLTMLALGAIWRALHEPRTRSGWLAAASVAYGLAVGARPSLLFGAVILLAPVIQAWRPRRQIWAVLMAATIPITLIGLGLMLYNELRFDNPFEFGLRYELAGQRQVEQQFFSLHYLWFNFRVYFLEPVRWSARFPFVREIAVPPVPPGHGGVEGAFGILPNIPLVWLALAAPLAWRSQPGQGASILRWFITAMAVFVGICVLTICLFSWADNRYEVDFLPALVLLAVVGILGVERTLAPASKSGLADRPIWRRAARWAWSLLLVFSVAFNLFAGVERYLDARFDIGTALIHAGRTPEAVQLYEEVLRIDPDSPQAHLDLGVALAQAGKMQEALGHYEQALRLNPDIAEAHYNLGSALYQLGRLQEAIKEFEAALRLRPDYAEAHVNLGNSLLTQGRMQDGIAHYEQALRIKPDYAEAHVNLGNSLLAQGRVQDAIAHYEQALRLTPDYAEVHYNLGIALAQAGRKREAIGHWEQALRLKPDYAKAHYNLGLALENLGRTPEAIEHYEQVLRLRPDSTAASNALARLRAGR
jgi:tetratricopeptide (TPR) repeat protein